jgi:hypothetical protein
MTHEGKPRTLNHEPNNPPQTTAINHHLLVQK